MNARPVILYGEDNESLRKAMARCLRRNFPEAEIVTCGTIRECKEALVSYHERITAIILDESWLITKRDGARLARSIRNGDFGEDIRLLPLALLSGDPSSFKAEPPVIQIEKGHPTTTDEILEFIRNYGFGSAQWAAVLDKTKQLFQAEQAQKIRDHNVKMLVNFFPPHPVDLLMSPEHHTDPNIVPGLMHNMPSQEARSFSQDRVQQMQQYMESAFSEEGPSLPWVRELIDAVDRDTFYIPDDGTANRYSVLKTRIRQKALQCMEQLAPYEVETYRQKSL